MERTPELFEQIEGYLTNTLPQDEYTSFEDRMRGDQELRIEVEKHKQLHNALSNADVLDFRQKLMDISAAIKAEQKEEQQEDVKKKNLNFSSFYKMAASVVVILGVGGGLWYAIYSNQHAQDLYASYYQPFPAEDTTRGDDAKDLNKVMSYYTHKIYDSVVYTIDKYPKLKEHQLLQVYLGNSYLNLDKEDKALATFKAINKGKYAEISEWYLALTYLKSNKIKDTKAVLNDIIAFDGLYRERAEQLLAELSK